MNKLMSDFKIVVILLTTFVLINSCKKEHQVKLRIENNFGVDITEVEAGGASYGDIKNGETTEYKIILSGQDRVLRFEVAPSKTYKTTFYITSRGKLRMQINPTGEDILFFEE